MSLYVDHEGSCLNVPCGEEPPARTLHQANLPGGAPALPDIGELLQALLEQELQVHGLLVQELRGSNDIEKRVQELQVQGLRIQWPHLQYVVYDCSA